VLAGSKSGWQPASLIEWHRLTNSEALGCGAEQQTTIAVAAACLCVKTQNTLEANNLIRLVNRTRPDGRNTAG